MSLKRTPLLFLSLAFCILAKSQQTYRINFDSSGKMLSTLPEKIMLSDTLKFLVNETGEKFSLYTDQFWKKIKKAQKNIKALLVDSSALDLLKIVYGIDTSDLRAVLTDLTARSSDPLRTGLANHVPPLLTDSNYFSLQFSRAGALQPIRFPPNHLSRSVPIDSASSQKEFYFTLTKTDPFQKLVYNWFDSTISSFSPYSNISQLIVGKQVLGQTVKTTQGFLISSQKELKLPKQESRYLESLLKAIDTATILDLLLSRTLNQLLPILHQPDKDWILNWLWYQDNKLPLLNPFPFRTEESFGEEPDTSELEGLRLKIAVHEEFYKSANLKHMRVSQIDSLIDETNVLKKRLDSIQKADTKYENKITKNTRNLEAFGTTSQELANGLLYVSSKTKVFVMRHHDASANYQLMNDLESGEYLEEDPVIILAHNLQKNQRVSLHLSFQEIAIDQTKIGDLIQKVKDELSLVKDIHVENANYNLTFDHDDVKNSELGPKIKAAQDSLRKRLDSLDAKLKIAARYNTAIEYMFAQSNPITKLDEIVDKSSPYHSEVANPVRKIDGPKKASYYMSTVTTPAANGTTSSTAIADTFHYRINKLYRIFPMAGIAYSPTKFNAITRDSGSAKDKNVAEPTNKLVFGLKFYLRSTDIRNPKFFLQHDNAGRRLLLSRTSIDIAFELKDPLHNIYTGLGLDLWPGFCVNAGSVFNRYTFNVYDNNQLSQTKKLYRAGIYVGLSSDISVLANLLKLLNLSK